MCESNELLVAFLYGELDPSDRRAFEAHLTACGECRDELTALRATRAHIATWTPPEPDFGFRIVRGAVAPPATPARRFRFVPAMGLAAAAALVLAAAAAIANVEVRYGGDGLVVRTGWSRDAGVSNAAAQPAGATLVDWKAQADVLDRRLRDLEAAAARAQSSAVQSAAGPDISDSEVLRRVRELLGQSETRQQRAFAVKLAELTNDIEAQRKLDLATIDQSMMRLQNTSGAEVKQYRDAIQRLYRAAYTAK
jgi:anti-sigma factor RsiW